jgi:hypothetical protein
MSPRSGKWTAQVCNGRNDDGTRIWICLGMFPTIEMAAIALTISFFHLRGESSASCLNFLHYVSHIKRILEDYSPLRNFPQHQVCSMEGYISISPAHHGRLQKSIVDLDR